MDRLESVSRYRIIAKLASGGFSAVYKAQDPITLRTIAIKVLPRTDASTKRHVLREARLASQIDHPNVAHVYEVGEINDLAYIVMEYVQGTSMRQLLSSGSLSAEKVLDAAVQICDALTAAHSRGIIHRDIKPENILVTERGRVKLVDFGLAKTFQRAESLDELTSLLTTEPNAIAGTPAYMSPEQLRGEYLDPRTDIFSFGVVLYEMVVGKRPFSGNSTFDVAASILNTRESDLGELSEASPPGIRPILHLLLQKDRSRRYQSVAQVKEDLLALSESQWSSERESPGAGSTPLWHDTPRVEGLIRAWPSGFDPIDTCAELISLYEFGESLARSQVENQSLQGLVLRLEEAGAGKNWWVDRICSNPAMASYRFEGADTAEGFFAENRFDRPQDLTFDVALREEFLPNIDMSSISVLGLYPSGALRSIPCEVSRFNGTVSITVRDYLVFLDPEAVQATTNIADFWAPITLFAIQC